MKKAKKLRRNESKKEVEEEEKVKKGEEENLQTGLKKMMEKIEVEKNKTKAKRGLSGEKAKGRKRS